MGLLKAIVVKKGSSVKVEVRFWTPDFCSGNVIIIKINFRINVKENRNLEWGKTKHESADCDFGRCLTAAAAHLAKSPSLRAALCSPQELLVYSEPKRLGSKDRHRHG